MEHIKLIENPEAESILSIEINAPAEDVYYYLERLGGDNGWYSYDSFLRLQNAIGAGKPRLRSTDSHVYEGSKIDFFHVESFIRNKMLILSFKAIGMAGENSYYLQEAGESKTIFTNEVRMNFSSIFGRIFWKFVNPFDRILRKKMLSNIRKFAESSEDGIHND